MICAVCYGVLRGHQGSQWRGTFDLHFDHQRNRTELKNSAAIRCCICRSILSELRLIEQKDRHTFLRFWKGLYPSVGKLIWGEPFRLNQSDLTGQSNFIGAYLSEVPELEVPQPVNLSEVPDIELPQQLNLHEVPETELPQQPTLPKVPHLELSQQPKIYRLDFKLKDSERLGTFVLEQVGAQSGGSLHTPFSSSTSSDEVLEVAKGWIRKCTSADHPDCPDEPPEVLPWYPKRLIDLGDIVKSKKGHRIFRDDPPHIADDPQRARKEDDPKDSDYVRLVSKDEGGRFMKGFYVTLSHCWGGATFTKLTEDTLSDFKKAINLKDLPQTFQDAIRFARRLGDKPGQVRYIWIDSLCILQADQPSKKQEEDWLEQSAQMHEIYKNSYCNISATAAVDSTKGLFKERKPDLLWEDEINLNTEEIPGYNPNDLIKRCKILDLSFWERHVEEAPVNKRAWVLQERLMAPRVLHFCEDQIAWECRKIDAAESFRDGLANFRLKAGDIERAERLKTFVPHVAERHIHGPSTSANGSAVSPHQTTYNHWRSVVERYSKTKLTNAGDKLIALSGIARLLSGSLPGVKYVAGLWGEYLASQLLWRVDPVFEHGKFSFPSYRPARYRAPSFSWAAVDAEIGITYGEFTKEGLLIKVEEFNILQDKGADEFGLVIEGCNLRLTGALKRIKLEKRLGENGLIRYRWDLAESPRGAEETYSNVYLDSPQDDKDILGPDGRVFCLPARINDEGYIVCLLLQRDKTKWGQYRRIGLTKVPPYDEEGQKQVYDRKLSVELRVREKEEIVLI